MNRQEILERAIACVTKDRNATHGEPEDNFRSIADYWTSYLQAAGLLVADTKVGSGDVAAMMILMKISRLATSPSHADHWIDIAGYSACGAECSHAIL